MFVIRLVLPSSTGDGGDDFFAKLPPDILEKLPTSLSLLSVIFRRADPILAKGLRLTGDEASVSSSSCSGACTGLGAASLSGGFAALVPAVRPLPFDDATKPEGIATQLRPSAAVVSPRMYCICGIEQYHSEDAPCRTKRYGAVAPNGDKWSTQGQRRGPNFYI